MTARAAGFASLRQWLRPLLLMLCVLALGFGGQATAADLAADATASISAVAASAEPIGATAGATDDCAPSPDKKGGTGHCAACCMHMAGQLLADGVALADPAWFGSAAMFVVIHALPPSAVIAAPDQPPQA